MVQRTVLCAAALAAFLSADTLVLRNGRLVDGDYLGGTPRTVRMQIGERTETFELRDVSEIRFGSSASSSSSNSSTSSSALEPSPLPRRGSDETSSSRCSQEYSRSSTASSSSSRETVPEGTGIVIRMIDDVDSERDGVGQTFRASTDEDVSVGGETVIPKGAVVVVKLIDDKESGKLSGRAELTLDLVSVQINGRMVDVMSEGVTQTSESRTARTGKVVGGTAALGAIIGAIAGGGKGAAIGAVSGAAAGGAVQVLTKGQRVRIPSETRLTFTLQHPLRP